LGNKPPDSPRPQGQPYDSLLKLLIEGQECEILPQLWPGVEYIETIDIEVLRSPLRVDRVYIVRYRKEKHVLHVEYETVSDGGIVYRLLEYHAYFLRKYKLPVLSIIVYPFQTTVVESPLQERSGGEVLLEFRFRTLCLWKLSAEDFVRERVFCMYALLPTMQGASEPLLRQAIDELVDLYRDNDRRLARELLWFGLLLRRVTSLPSEVKQRIEEKLSMWDNLIAEDPKLKKWFDMERLEGREEGREEGRAEALAEASAALRSTVLSTLERRFPRLVEESQASIENIRSFDSLRQLIAEIAVAQDEDAARRAIEAYL
jgi:predicted transposase YdaD